MAFTGVHSPAGLENLFILGSFTLEEYGKPLFLPISLINDSKDIFQLTKDMDWMRDMSMPAVSAACIFMACKQAEAEMDLAELVYDIMADMCKALEMLWVVEHLVAGVKPVAQMPLVRYEEAVQGEADTYIVKNKAKKIILAWPSIMENTDTVLPGEYDIESPSLMNLYETAVWQAIDEILTRPTLPSQVEKSEVDDE